MLANKQRKNFKLCMLVVLGLMGFIIAKPIQAQAAILYWPVPGHTRLSQGYHDGNAIDISDGSIAGAKVIAAIGGKVTHIYKCGSQHYGKSCSCNGFGTGLVIAGDDGRIYQYAHMQAGSIPGNVYHSAYVNAGQEIGKVGTTGNSTGNHLHFAISRERYWYASGINPSNESYIYSSGAGNYANLGDRFKGIILRQDIWCPIKVDETGNVVLSSIEYGISQEQWLFERQSDGSYIITSLYNGQALDVKWGTFQNETNIWTYTKSSEDNPAQRWYIYYYGNGYIISPKGNTGMVLDVCGGGTANGTNIWLYEKNESAAQVFAIWQFTDNTITSVNLTESTLRMEKGENYQLRYSYSPSNSIYNRDMKWTTSDSKVVSVDKKGKVTAVGTGTATITMICQYNDQLKDKVTITVTEPLQEDTSDEDEEEESENPSEEVVAEEGILDDEDTVVEENPTEEESEIEEIENVLEEEELVAEGTSLVYNQEVYEVLVSNGGRKEVAYTGSLSRTRKSISIPAEIWIKGMAYKVTQIDDKACKNYKKLKNVTVGKYVEVIGKEAFRGCKNLKTITIKSTKLTKNTVGKNAFKSTNKKLVIKVPKKKVNSYKKFLKTKGNKKVTVKKG